MSDSRRVLVLWFIALGLITWREYKRPAADAILVGWPRPWAYSSSAAAYAVAALVAEANGPFGVALAAAWTVAIFLGYFGAQGSAAPVKAAA